MANIARVRSLLRFCRRVISSWIFSSPSSLTWRNSSIFASQLGNGLLKFQKIDRLLLFHDANRSKIYLARKVQAHVCSANHVGKFSQ